MPLDSHKYVTPEVLRQVEDQIGFIRQSIERYKTISKGGKEGREEAVKLMKEVRHNAGVMRDRIMAFSPPEKNVPVEDAQTKINRALVLSGEERAYTHMITMLEDSKSQISFYQEELSRMENHLSELKKLSVRK